MYGAMPSYLFQAEDGAGAAVSDRIEATNLGQARYILETRGYRDIRFHEDEHGDDIRQMIRADTQVSAPAAGWGPAQEIESRRRRTPWQKFSWALKLHLYAIIPLLLWNALALLHGPPWRAGDWLGFIATPLYLGYFVLLAAPAQVFHQILVASAWKDWERLRFFVRLARGLRAMRRTGIPERELRVREAYALADEGQLDAALRIMEEVRARPNHKEYLHLGRLAAVYQYAGQYDRQIECLREAQRLSPGGASQHLDLAAALLRRRRDVAGARQELELAKEKELTELAKIWVAWCEGFIACEEGDFTRAKAEFRAALAHSQNTGSPLLEIARAEINASLCVACARSGETAAAQACWLACRELLLARREADLIRRCEAALAGAGQS